MKNLLLFLLCLFAVEPVVAQTGFSMKIYAGSNASRGKFQYLTIDGQGKTVYSLSEVNKGQLDSSSFTLTRAQLRVLEQALADINFYSLDKFYNAKSVDGTRLTVEAASGSRSNKVAWFNTHPAETVRLLERLNAILTGRGITIVY